MKTRAKPELILKIKLKERIFINYTARSLQDAKQVRKILSPPDGPIAYSNFKLYRDGKEIEF